jgi:hypothetical protein
LGENYDFDRRADASRSLHLNVYRTEVGELEGNLYIDLIRRHIKERGGNVPEPDLDVGARKLG